MKPASEGDELDATARAKRVREAALALGFDDVGFVQVDDADVQFERYNAAIERGDLDPLPYLTRDDAVQARKSVRVRMPTARTVVVVVHNYYVGDLASVDDESSRIARYAWGRDYHSVMRKRLRKLRGVVLQTAPRDNDVVVGTFVDTSPVLERAHAVLAGLGFIGKSTMFIHRRLGTWTFLGGLISNVPMTPSAPVRVEPNRCGTCTACIDACPTGALTPFALDARRCLTTWSVEKPIDAPADLPTHGWALGCDICQEVCPWNRFQKVSDDDAYRDVRYRSVSLSTLPNHDELVGSPVGRAGTAGLTRTLTRPR